MQSISMVMILLFGFSYEFSDQRSLPSAIEEARKYMMNLDLISYLGLGVI